ncbi:MAG: hypothetical protein NC300_11300 [Bacteroidales bacterium]|nr:hypothetical protein [Clostridium sp.]MCM1204717.1 hypothetical protein [Bacteroidales bacterium]
MKEKIIELTKLPKVMVTKREAAEQIGVEARTIQNYMNEIEAYKDRYGEKATIRGHGYSLVNILVLYDYLHYREKLKQKNLKQYIPPYNPDEWIKVMAWKKTMEA